MSDLNAEIEQELVDGQEVQEEVAEQEAVEQDLPQVSEAQAKALQKGWQTKEDWVASGKDADEWISATHFNKNGDVIRQMQELKRAVKGTEQRLADNNALHAAKLQVEREQLLQQRDNAIEDADKVEVKRIDKQINSIDQQAVSLNQAAPQAPAEDLQVENNFFNSLPFGQTQFAQQAAAHYINSQKLSGQELVDAVQTEIQKQFNTTPVNNEPTPKVNERRNKPSITDAKKPAARKPQGASVDSLTAQDRSVIQSMRNMSSTYAKKSDAEMIKILNDSKI